MKTLINLWINEKAKNLARIRSEYLKHGTPLTDSDKYKLQFEYLVFSHRYMVTDDRIKSLYPQYF